MGGWAGEKALQLNCLLTSSVNPKMSPVKLDVIYGDHDLKDLLHLFPLALRKLGLCVKRIRVCGLNAIDLNFVIENSL